MDLNPCSGIIMKLQPAELNSFLNELCDIAQRETLTRFREPIDVVNKKNESFDPVTQADQAAELAIRNRILDYYPQHGVLGEEFGSVNPEAEYQWIIDPIDGTRAFISGLPTWGTLIGLYKNGKPYAGIMHQPFTDERYLCNGETSVLHHKNMTRGLQTSEVQDLSEATLMTTSPTLFDRDELPKYQSVEAACKLPRYGTDCYAYCLLASGHIELVIEAGLNVYDIAALIPIVERAGGVFTNWQGGDASQGGQVLVAANPQIHAEALYLLQ